MAKQCMMVCGIDIQSTILIQDKIKNNIFSKTTYNQAHADILLSEKIKRKL